MGAEGAVEVVQQAAGGGAAACSEGAATIHVCGSSDGTGSSLYPSLDRARASTLGKTVGVQQHKKWAPWFVAQIPAPSVTTGNVHNQWLPKYPHKEDAALAYDIANAWRAIRGIADVTEHTARFNFPAAGYLSDSALRAKLAPCATFKDLKDLIKSELLPEPPPGPELRQAGASDKSQGPRASKAAALQAGCIRIDLTAAKLRECRMYLKTEDVRQAFQTAPGSEDAWANFSLLATAVDAHDNKQQTFELTFGTPGRDGLPFVATSLRPLLDALGAQPGDVLQLQYTGCGLDGTVQVAASLPARQPSSKQASGAAAGQPQGAGLAAAGPHAGPCTTGGEAQRSHSSATPQRVRPGTSDRQLSGGEQRGTAAAAAEGVEQAEAADAELLLGMRQSSAAPAGAQQAGQGSPVQLAAQRGGAVPPASRPRTADAGVAAAPSADFAATAAEIRRRPWSGSTTEPAAKRQAVEAGGDRVPAVPAQEGQQPTPVPPWPSSSQRQQHTSADAPQPQQHTSADAPQPQQQQAAQAQAQAALPRQQQVPMPAATHSSQGGAPAHEAAPTAAVAVTAASIEEAASLLEAVQRVDEQQRQREQARALMRALRLAGLDRSLRMDYFAHFAELSLTQQDQQVVIIHDTLDVAEGGPHTTAEEVAAWVRQQLAFWQGGGQRAT